MLLSIAPTSARCQRWWRWPRSLAPGEWNGARPILWLGIAEPSALMPTLIRSFVRCRRWRLREHYRHRLVIDWSCRDYYASTSKALRRWMGAPVVERHAIGRVLPCHAAETIPGLEFWSVRDRTLVDIWMRSPAFQAFRGTGWMREPCRSCELRDIDFGGCRCQALAIAGDRAGGRSGLFPIASSCPDAYAGGTSAVRSDAAGAADTLQLPRPCA